jgi:hypothetical protein
MNALQIGDNLRSETAYTNWFWVTKPYGYHRWDTPDSWIDVTNGRFERYISKIVATVKSI